MNIATMDRAALEFALIENDILPMDAADIARVNAMSDDDLRALVAEWIAAGDECS
jgi:hypothetical protein